jgi:hypothetical protein
MAQKPVTVTKDNLSKVLNAVKQLTSQVVLVGVPGENAERKPVPGEKNTITNPVIGYINEFGSPERNIPARPHLVPAINGIQDKINARMLRMGQQALSLKPDVIDAGFNGVGLMGQVAVQKYIQATLKPPLAALTLARRKSRKVAPRQGEQPLIDTGAYLQSITYVVRKKSEL